MGLIELFFNSNSPERERIAERIKEKSPKIKKPKIKKDGKIKR